MPLLATSRAEAQQCHWVVGLLEQCEPASTFTCPIGFKTATVLVERRSLRMGRAVLVLLFYLLHSGCPLTDDDATTMVNMTMPCLHGIFEADHCEAEGIVADTTIGYCRVKLVEADPVWRRSWLNCLTHCTKFSVVTLELRALHESLCSSILRTEEPDLPQRTGRRSTSRKL